MTTIADERLDRLATQIQETGTAIDLPEYLLAAAKLIGLTTFTLTDQGVLLYRLTAPASPASAGRQEDQNLGGTASQSLVVKPASGITNWGQWPEDVEPTLREWNSKRGLSFLYPPIGQNVIGCDQCRQRFRISATYAKLNGQVLCDDCLIQRAREGLTTGHGSAVPPKGSDG